mgnify:CR=1 FL=1
MLEPHRKDTTKWISPFAKSPERIAIGSTPIESRVLRGFLHGGGRLFGASLPSTRAAGPRPHHRTHEDTEPHRGRPGSGIPVRSERNQFSWKGRSSCTYAPSASETDAWAQVSDCALPGPSLYQRNRATSGRVLQAQARDVLPFQLPTKPKLPQPTAMRARRS